MSGTTRSYLFAELALPEEPLELAGAGVAFAFSDFAFEPVSPDEPEPEDEPDPDAPEPDDALDFSVDDLGTLSLDFARESVR